MLFAFGVFIQSMQKRENLMLNLRRKVVNPLLRIQYRRVLATVSAEILPMNEMEIAFHAEVPSRQVKSALKFWKAEGLLIQKDGRWYTTNSQN